MKYVLIFVLVFLAGFGLLQWMGSNADQDKMIPEVEAVIPASKDTIAVLPPEIKDTTNYIIKDGFYEINWEHLSKVDFVDRLNDTLKTMVTYPVFQAPVKKLDGQKIRIKGYVIPFEETGDATIVILSAFPFTSCFFCGGAGPETVIDVQLKNQKKRFKQDAMVTFQGKLRLNDSDLDYLNYILDDAEVAH